MIGRHPGAWAIPFQAANAAAGPFWRGVARRACGEAWTETTHPVAGKPDAPPDHWVRMQP